MKVNPNVLAPLLHYLDNTIIYPRAIVALIKHIPVKID